LKRIIIVFLMIIISLAQEKQIDLNNASLEDLKQLNIDKDLISKIYRHRIEYGRYESVYELLDIEGIDTKLFQQIKMKLYIEPFAEESYRTGKIELVYRKITDLASEDANDNESDLFIDLALSPMNINKMSYQDIANLPNVTPIDATRITEHLETGNSIQSARDLRNVGGLSFYGYWNARDFIEYSDNIGYDNNVHGFYTYRTFDTPFFGEEGNTFSSTGYHPLEKRNSFNQYHKARFNYNQFKIGVSHSKNLGEDNHNDFKWYASADYLDLGDGFRLDRIILGNFKATWSHGVVMESTDFFTPRKDGFGYKKRFSGIIGDISRSRNHDLRGLAFQVSYKNRFDLNAFYSNAKRDAILNSDGSINQFINLQQRFSGEYYHYEFDNIARDENPNTADLKLVSVPNMVKNVEEQTMGGELKLHLEPGTFVAFTIYQSLYNRLLRPDLISLYANGANYINNKFLNEQEIASGLHQYGGEGTDTELGKFKSFRRVYGFHGQYLINDLALSAEIGFLDYDGNKSLSFSDSTLDKQTLQNPKAMVLSAYYQKENFNVLFMYRDYDLAYDNPYQHSISNYERYKSTTIKDPFRLKSPYYAQLHLSADQPQAERGFHVRSRYRFSNSLTFQNESDIWKRVSDDVENYRHVFRLQYRPIYPLRFGLRQKWQARDEENPNSLDFFTNNETIFTVESFLSGRDYIRFSLGASLTKFSGRSDLVFNPNLNQNSYDLITASTAVSGHYIGAYFQHNFNEHFNVKVNVLNYKGFYWGFEDTQFVVSESLHGAYRAYISFFARMNSNVSARIKYTFDDRKHNNNSFVNNANGTGNDRIRQQYFNLEETGKKNSIYFELIMQF
jgi:DNA uptake protein ComE-like DNA-binding protein